MSDAAPREIEAKFPVPSLRRVAARLRAAGAEYLGTALQTDRFFDTPDRALYRGDRGLRIRTVRRLRGPAGAGGDRPQVTYKGPRQAGRKAKTRLELQTHVDDAGTLEGIFEACGLVDVLILQKKRATYRLGACLVELDELPRIGRFVEIEGPEEGAIWAARDALRLAGEPTTEPYIALIDAACGRVDTCREVTFERCAGCTKRPPRKPQP